MKILTTQELIQIQESNERAAGFDQHQDRMNRFVKPLPAKVSYSLGKNKGKIYLLFHTPSRILYIPYLKQGTNEIGFQTLPPVNFPN